MRSPSRRCHALRRWTAFTVRRPLLAVGCWLFAEQYQLKLAKTS